MRDYMERTEQQEKVDIIWQQLCYWGKDDLIMDICPAYETDALVRRVNVDRYDDRGDHKNKLNRKLRLINGIWKKNICLINFFIEGVE